MSTNPESAAVEAVAYARCGQDGKPWYDDVVLPNSQEAEMWAYNLAPLYPQSALDALRGEVRDLTADRDSWMDQAEERVRNWHEEHEARLAAERRVAELEKLMAAARRAIGDHHAPNDCYATGPLTGDEFLDLVQCPACAFIDQYAALTKE